MDTPDFLPSDEQLTDVLRSIDFDSIEELAGLQQEYRQTHASLSAQSYSQRSGISPAAFTEATRWYTNQARHTPVTSV